MENKAIKIIFDGIPPSKKNSKKWIYRGGRKYLVPSDNHQAWHERVSWELKRVKTKFKTVSLIKIVFYPTDRIKRDKTNVAESIMDFLKDMAIIPDDNWFIVTEINLKFGGVVKENPRVEVEIQGQL